MSGSFTSSNVVPSNLDELKCWLEQMVKQLAFTRLLAVIIALVSRLTSINAELTKQLAHLRRARPRSERWKALEAQLAFTWAVLVPPAGNKPEQAPPVGNPPEKSPPKKRSRKGRHPGRLAFPADLKRVPQYNGVPPELRFCPKCGLEMSPLGHTQCEYLEVKPAEIFVVRRSDEAVKCELDGTIVSAPPPPRIVERSVLGNRLIIEATADKFLEHQPIERQCLRYARSGVEIAPQTLLPTRPLTEISGLVPTQPFVRWPKLQLSYSKHRGPVSSEEDFGF
ncbi:MAG TPA: hypothetical protein VFS67_14395 [Polyangiaceae bacterium]|nr:hypothetical protein [Polyangiaceae bacterium]